MDRKKEHIENYLKSEYQGDTMLSCVYLEHQALTRYNWEDINTRVSFLGHTLEFPLIINAMTGGNETACDINEDLARLASEFGIAMATGSEKIALMQPEACESFQTVRQTAPNTVIIGNLSARESLDDVLAAISLIGADAMGLHLNTVQELIMAEGDRAFAQSYDNLCHIAKNTPVPLIVKEVGYGLSRHSCDLLHDIGIRWMDVSGHGGTNFSEIEDGRRFDRDYSELYQWGIPTAKCLYDLRDRPHDMHIIASGGLKNASDIVRAFVLGADMCAISGEILRYLMHGGYAAAKEYIASLIDKTRILMLSLNCCRIEELKEVPFKIVGPLKDLI